MNGFLSGKPFRQEDRLPDDGAIRIEVEGHTHLRIIVETHGETYSLLLSRFNAARAFAMLSFFLGISLPKKLAKEIKL